MTDLQGLALAGSFTGVFLRTIIDYVRVRAQAEETEGKPLEFDRKFAVTAILAAGTAGTFAVIGSASLAEQIPVGSTTLSAFIFAMTAGLGAIVNHGFNLAISTGTTTIRASKETISSIKHFIAEEGLDQIKKSKKRND